MIMTKAKLVQKKIQLDNHDIIKYQLLTYCFANKIKISDAGLECLVTLACSGNTSLSEFCNIVVDNKIFKTSQTVRNFLTDVEQFELVIKTKGNKKFVQINPNLKIQVTGNIILNYQMIYVSEEN